MVTCCFTCLTVLDDYGGYMSDIRVVEPSLES